MRDVNAQLSLIATPCKESGCAEPIVGSSVTGEGHVCRRHNEIEWGRALIRSGYWPEMGARLIASGAR